MNYRKAYTNHTLKSRLNPYPAYKDSCIEWLGGIPAHWEVKRLKYAVNLNPASTEARTHDDSLEVSFIPMEAVGEYGGLELVTTKPIRHVYDGYTYFREGDVLVAKITPCFENGKGAIATGLVNKIAFGTTELHILRTKSTTNRQFLFYLSMGDAFRKLGQAQMYGAGGQKRVPESFIADLLHPLPPLQEQRAIAAFLDRETTRIDTLVAKKERLIELLQEKRSALISHAVTRGLPADVAAHAGLDPNVPMKDSGVEWIGEIPAHWEVQRFKTLGRNFANGTTAEQMQQGVSDFPVSRIETISTGKIDYTRVGYLSEFRVIESFILKPDDFLISHINSYERVGNSARYKGNRTLIHGMNLIRVTPLKIIAPGYLEFLLKSPLFKEGMKRACKPAINQVSVPTTAVKAIQFALPPLPEQRSIAKFLDRETAKIDALVGKVREAIDRLKELRSALISAAVTGKIDVREAPARVPDESGTSTAEGSVSCGPSG